MSMHKIQLTNTEETGLRVHGLDIGTPSQLSDVFRLGVAWGQKHPIDTDTSLGETNVINLTDPI